MRDQGSPAFSNYGVAITFCDVDPELYAMMTNQDVVYDSNGDAVGFLEVSAKFLDGQPGRVGVFDAVFEQIAIVIAYVAGCNDAGPTIALPLVVVAEPNGAFAVTSDPL